MKSIERKFPFLTSRLSCKIARKAPKVMSEVPTKDLNKQKFKCSKMTMQIDFKQEKPQSKNLRKVLRNVGPKFNNPIFSKIKNSDKLLKYTPVFYQRSLSEFKPIVNGFPKAISEKRLPAIDKLNRKCFNQSTNRQIVYNKFNDTRNNFITESISSSFELLKNQY